MELKIRRHASVLVILICFSFKDQFTESIATSEKFNKTLRKFTGKIYGGKKVSIGAYPSIVGLLEDGYQICGGTIIGSKVVLTAAHCYGSKDYNYTLRVGSTYRSSGGTIHEISEFIIHQDYDSHYFDYDFAIVKTKKHFSRDRITDIVSSPVPAYAKVWVAGWGASESYESTEELNRAELHTLSTNLCKTAVSPYKITKSMLCAMNSHEGIDTCTGDSGGPLYYENKLAGVTSWGIKCGETYPGIYSNVFTVRYWIKVYL